VTCFRFLMTSALLTVAVSAFDKLPPDQIALLQDPGGWEYVSMDDSQDGFPTQHTCFDGTPHPDACRGLLTLRSSKTFTQEVFIHQQSVARHGRYELKGDKLAFFDEFGTRDGPYTISVDTVNKLMTMDMPQVKVRLMLYKEYKKQMDEKQKHKDQ
jgi:hypothetical protein